MTRIRVRAVSVSAETRAQLIQRASATATDILKQTDSDRALVVYKNNGSAAVYCEDSRPPSKPRA